MPSLVGSGDVYKRQLVGHEDTSVDQYAKIADSIVAVAAPQSPFVNAVSTEFRQTSSQPYANRLIGNLLFVPFTLTKSLEYAMPIYFTVLEPDHAGAGASGHQRGPIKYCMTITASITQ